MQNQFRQEEKDNACTLALLSELGQVGELERFLLEQPGTVTDYLIVALSLEIETKLEERGISFVSVGRYKKIFPDQLIDEDVMMAEFFSDQRWKKFSYRGIPLLITFRFMFRAYLQRARYYSNLLISILETHQGVSRLVLFSPSEKISNTFGNLAKREINVVVDCAKTIASIRGISVTVIQPKSFATLRDSLRPVLFSAQRAIFGFLLILWNAVVVTSRRSRHPRLLISDHWGNVGSSIRLLKYGECIFFDRSEIKCINWRLLLRYRMRFVHFENFLTHKMCVRAKECGREFIDIWNKMRGGVPSVFSFQGHSLDPLFLGVVDDVVYNLEKTLYQIEGAYAMYEKLQPDLVMLRASVSGQTHFSVLPLVAKMCGIPSLELQHGLEYLGPGSWSREHVAEYIAVYGSLVKKELVSIGCVADKIWEVGSPRMDNYPVFKEKKIKDISRGKLTLLCIAPDIRPFEIYDSYSAEEYFKVIARAVEKLKEKHIIVKLRPGPANDGLLRAIIARAFSHIPYTIAQNESIADLCVRADVVISCYSTTILEVLRIGLPTIIPVLNRVDAMVTEFHFSRYHDAGALHIVSNHQGLTDILLRLVSHPELRDELRKNAYSFIRNNFCFDGDSSRRLTTLVLELAAKKASRKLS
ncbi:CDP-glycerol glycerophosphotransferase family protein [Candidatus Nomurabacteria bacterium]|nr:CDP-glycerol glycerophosphotransferase family protein [Candidatus Nomurabacteria bacterium]